MQIQTSLSFRRAVRAAVNSQQNNIPVRVVPGNVAPRVTGESFHYETKGGTRIDYPSAYSKRGWSNMVYVASSRRVEVGAEFALSA